MARKPRDEKPRIYFDDLKHRWSRLWFASADALAKREESGRPSNVVPLAARRAAVKIAPKH